VEADIIAEHESMYGDWLKASLQQCSDTLAARPVELRGPCAPSPKPEEPVRDDTTPDPVEMAGAKAEAKHVEALARDLISAVHGSPQNDRTRDAMWKLIWALNASTTDTARGSSGQGQGKGEAG
jgi:hypothetical protein